MRLPQDYGYGHWELVAISVGLFLLFLAYIPFRRKVERLPASIYVAFIAALFAEMYGFPLTIFILSWLIGYKNPLTHDAGHLLWGGMYTPGHFATVLVMAAGAYLIISSYKLIYKSQATQSGLVTEGPYRYVRHPQYLGIMLLTGGLLLQWVTIPTLLMWPLLTLLYIRLARIEEREMELKCGDTYIRYKEQTPMFLPSIWRLFLSVHEKTGQTERKIVGLVTHS